MTDWNAHRAQDAAEAAMHPTFRDLLAGFKHTAGYQDAFDSLPWLVGGMVRSNRSDLEHLPICTGDRLAVYLDAYLLDRITLDEFVEGVLSCA